MVLFGDLLCDFFASGGDAQSLFVVGKFFLPSVQELLVQQVYDLDGLCCVCVD